MILPSRIAVNVFWTSRLFSYFNTNSLIKSTYFPSFILSSIKNEINSLVNCSLLILLSRFLSSIYDFNSSKTSINLSSELFFILLKSSSIFIFILSVMYIPFSLMTNFIFLLTFLLLLPEAQNQITP